MSNRMGKYQFICFLERPIGLADRGLPGFAGKFGNLIQLLRQVGLHKLEFGLV